MSDRMTVQELEHLILLLYRLEYEIGPMKSIDTVRGIAWWRANGADEHHGHSMRVIQGSGDEPPEEVDAANGMASPVAQAPGPVPDELASSPDQRWWPSFTPDRAWRRKWNR